MVAVSAAAAKTLIHAASVTIRAHTSVVLLLLLSRRRGCSCGLCLRILVVRLRVLLVVLPVVLVLRLVVWVLVREHVLLHGCCPRACSRLVSWWVCAVVSKM